MKLQINLMSGEKIFKIIHLFMAVLFFLTSIYVVALNNGQRLIIASLCIVFFGLTCFRHLYLANRRKNIWRVIFPYIEGSIMVTIVYMDAANFGLSLLTLAIMDIAVDYAYGYGIIYCVLGYVIYISKYIRLFEAMSLVDKVALVIIGGLQFTVYVGFAFLARMYSDQSRELTETTAELHTRMIAMEEMAVLKERNRIAGEIHNTVGHQLTTALIQVEAAQLLIEKDPEKAKMRLGIIKDQVKDGLNELRKSIHAISAEEEYKNFTSAVRRLEEQVKAHSGISLEFKMDDIEEGRLLLKKTLYHVILESITNGIRHGHCRKVKVNLEKNQGTITLSIFNDGEVPMDMKCGFGLNKMRESIKDIGGRLSFRINEDGWYGIISELPLYYQEVNVHEQN